MASYDDIIRKYNPGYFTPKPGDAGFVGPVKPAPVITEDQRKITIERAEQLAGLKADNPYFSVIYNLKAKEQKAAKEESFKKLDQAIEEANNPSFKQQVKNFVSSFSWSNIKSTYQNEVKPHGIAAPAIVVSSGVNSLLDIGPTIVNGLASIVGVQKRLPLPGQTLNEWIGNDSDLAHAVNQGTVLWGAYELGGAAVPKIGILKNPVANRVVGNVVGGQLTLDDASGTERAKQAAFDTAFALATEGVTAAIRRGARGRAGGGRAEPGDVSDISGRLGQTVDEGFVTKPVRSLEEIRAGEPDLVARLKKGAPEPEVRPGGESTDVVYLPKKDLGVDNAGEKILARTEVDAKTGRAIIYYDRILDQADNTQLRAEVFDHEFGHVLDKRINQGNNFSAELPNYGPNRLSIDRVLGEFAASQGAVDVQTVAKALQTDIDRIATGSNAAETFANAVAKFRNDPQYVRQVAATFADFMDHQLVTPRISEHVVTSTSLKAPARKGISDVAEPTIKPPTEQPIRKAPAPAQQAPTVKTKTQTKIGDGAAPGSESTLISGTGLRTGKFVEGRKAFNPKSINAPDEVVDLFEQLGADADQFRTQRISKGNQDIKDLAQMVGLTEDQLAKARPGSIANSETVTKARQLVLDKSKELLDYAKALDPENASPAQLQGLKDRWLKLVSMQKAVAGFRTEASNVFRSLGIEVLPGENATLAELGRMIKNTGVASGDDAALFSKNIAKEIELTRAQKVGAGLLNTWYSAILSGPKTTVRNLLSTSANILTELAAKAVNPMQWNELGASVRGLIKGLGDGWLEAKGVLKGDLPATTKFLDTNQASLKGEVFTGSWKTYGDVVQSVGRWLNAQDRLLAASAREMEALSLKASKKFADIDPKLNEAISKMFAERSVYHGVPTGRVLQGLREAAHAIRRKAPIFKIVVPFVDTVANVMDRQFDYVPIFSQLRLRESVIAPQVERIAKEFGITDDASKAIIKQRIYDQQVGRMWLGTMLTGASVAMAAKGLVSGSGPSNYDERNQLQATGWRPNSIKIGDTWVPYTYFGPLAGIFAMAGNIHDKIVYDKSPTKDLGSLIANGMVGWTQTQLDQSFLSGVADVFDVMTGGIAPSKYLTNLGAGLVPIPALYSQTKDMIFRQQYETRSIQEKIMLKLGLTADLEPRLSALGEPQKADLIYGITPSGVKSDPVYDFLNKNQIIVSKPKITQRYTNPKDRYGEKIQLNEQEYTQYVQSSGTQIYERLRDMVPSLEFLPDDEKKKAVEKLVDDIRERERNQIFYGK